MATAVFFFLWGLYYTHITANTCLSVCVSLCVACQQEREKEREGAGGQTGVRPLSDEHRHHVSWFVWTGNPHSSVSMSSDTSEPSTV